MANAFEMEEMQGGSTIINLPPTSRQGVGRPLGSTGGGGFLQPPINPPILTNAGDNAAQNAEVLVKNDNINWINNKWRPAMAWLYMIICGFDFIVAPVLWAILQSKLANIATQWQPLTLQGAGLFHVAMGAVLGIAAFGRTKEKIELSKSISN